MPREEAVDESSPYGAPEWNLERQSAAEDADLATLPESELATIRHGLHKTVEHTGTNRLSRNMFDGEQDQKGEKHEKISKKRRTLEETKKSPVAKSRRRVAQKRNIWGPAWLETWSNHFKGQQWGFVIFRAACQSGTEEDEKRWAWFKEQVQRIVELPFERALMKAKEEGRPIPDNFNEARSKFTIRWEEEAPAKQKSTGDVSILDSLRSRYAALKRGLEPGLTWRILLCASPEAVQSFEELAPYTDEKSHIRRPQAPFLLAVGASRLAHLQYDDYESSRLKPVFKVAVEALVEPFFSVLGTGTPLWKVTRYVWGTGELGGSTVYGGRESDLNEIWWSTHPSPQRQRTRYCKGNGSPQYC